jgi:hypothetical protein
MEWSTIAGLASAGGLGGIVSNMVNAAPSRRRARAQVREAVLKLEELLPRWSLLDGRGQSFDPDAWDVAVRVVKVECLAAAVPRRLTDSFLAASRNWSSIYRLKGDYMTVGEWETLDDWATGHGRLLHDYLWHPWGARLTYRRRLRALDTQFREFNEQAKRHHAAELANRQSSAAQVPPADQSVGQ